MKVHVIAQGGDDVSIDYDPIPMVEMTEETTGNLPYVLVVLNPENGEIRQFSNGDVASQAKLLADCSKRTSELAAQFDADNMGKH